MSGPLVVVDELDVLVVVSCFAIACCASACPSSPSGLFALSPAVGSDVTFGTGGAGYRFRVLECGTLVL